MNIVAQLVECIHVVLDSISIIDTLLDSYWQQPKEEFQVKAGIGTAAVEVPRGTLYHSYEIDEHGVATKADCVVPTGQNHPNIYYDIVELATECAKQEIEDDKIELLAAMLIRAYDPCISCSVH